MSDAPRPTRPTTPHEPLTPPALHILLALVDADRHGLGIPEHVQTFTQGRITLGPGTLYGAIKRLLELGFLEDAPDRPKKGQDDPRRRYYHLTAPGRRAVQAEARAMAQVVDVAR